LIALVPWLACTSASMRPQLDVLDLVVGGHNVTAEIADEEHERQKGLMYRKGLGKDAGMLFVYPAVKQHSFWMENTQIPLSIAYIREDASIATIKDMTPFDKTSVPSEAVVLYALEMTQGWFAAHEVQPGDRVEGLPGPSAQ
jgi:uncharacterized membrane protein (UPF0127 family)